MDRQTVADVVVAGGSAVVTGRTRTRSMKGDWC